MPLSVDFDARPGQSRAGPVDDIRIGRPKRILVVGGGPAGLISLHELLNPFNRPFESSLKEFDIKLYERRAEVGGVWYYELDNKELKGWPSDAQSGHQLKAVNGSGPELGSELGQKLSESVPQGNSGLDSGSVSQNVGADNGHTSVATSHSHGPGKDLSVASDAARHWPSPAYEGLVGNVLPPLLQFSAFSMAKPADGLFPSMTETHQYLLDFAKPLRSHICTNREVISVVPSADNKWSVHSIDHSPDSKDGTPATVTVETWDAVVVAPGAFDKPWWPTDIPGLAELRASNSPLVMHAKTYPGPRPFVHTHNKIVVVGNANSANDIAAHLAPLNNEGPLYRCCRHESLFAHLKDDRIKDVAPIASIELVPASEGATAADTLTITLTDGVKIPGVTKLILATGYQYEFPWLRVPASASESKQAQDHRPASAFGAVPGLHLGTFHSAAPNLAFVGLAVNSNPMPTAETQARLASRVFHGVHALPLTLGADFAARKAELGLHDDREEGWRSLHMCRGAAERANTAALLAELDRCEPGASEGLFRWDEEREEIVRTMRSVKEGELQRIRDRSIAAGGVDGGVGGILAVSAGETARDVPASGGLGTALF